eukprot:3795316-Amphidinium_carterae.1
MATAAATKVHKKKLAELNTWVNKEVKQWQGDMVLEHLKDMFLLDQDLPAGTFAEVFKKGIGKLQQWLSMKLDELCNGGGVTEDLQQLQDIMAEA